MNSGSTGRTVAQAEHSVPPKLINVHTWHVHSSFFSFTGMLEIKCSRAASTDTFFVSSIAFLQSTGANPMLIKASRIFLSTKGSFGSGGLSALSTLSALLASVFLLSVPAAFGFYFYFSFSFSFCFSFSILGTSLGILFASLDYPRQSASIL